MHHLPLHLIWRPSKQEDCWPCDRRWPAARASDIDAASALSQGACARRKPLTCRRCAHATASIALAAPRRALNCRRGPPPCSLQGAAVHSDSLCGGSGVLVSAPPVYSLVLCRAGRSGGPTGNVGLVGAAYRRAPRVPQQIRSFFPD